MWDLSSLTGDRTRAPCISALGAQGFNHWTAREVPKISNSVSICHQATSKGCALGAVCHWSHLWMTWGNPWLEHVHFTVGTPSSGQQVFPQWGSWVACQCIHQTVYVWECVWALSMLLCMCVFSVLSVGFGFQHWIATRATGTPNFTFGASLGRVWMAEQLWTASLPTEELPDGGSEPPIGSWRGKDSRPSLRANRAGQPSVDTGMWEAILPESDSAMWNSEKTDRRLKKDTHTYTMRHREKRGERQSPTETAQIQKGSKRETDTRGHKRTRPKTREERCRESK